MNAHHLPVAVRFLSAGAIALAAVDADGVERVQIDQPDAWYEPGVSHHGKHGIGGAAIGFAGYYAADLVGADRLGRYATAVGAGATIGIAYELVEGRNGHCYADPIDALWVTAGALAGAAIADLTHQTVVSLAPVSHGAAINVAMRF